MIGAAIATLLPISDAKAEYVYSYTGKPLTSEYGVALQGAVVNFSFTTPQLLPPNLTLEYKGLVNPTFSVPVTDWLLSAGSFSANSGSSSATLGLAGLDFLLFGTNSAGAITSWFMLNNTTTTNGQHYISVTLNHPDGVQTIFGTGPEYVQVNPLSGYFTEAALAFTPGHWTVAAVPEPHAVAMLLAGLGVLTVAVRRRALR